MTTQTTLAQALQELAELKNRAGLMNADELNKALDKLKDLLSSAAQSPTGALTAPTDANPNAELHAFMDTSANFNSTMVHELRKPMTSIRGYADMLAKPGLIGPLNPTQQQFMDTIRNNVIRMEGLVSDISDINKLTALRYKPNLNPVSIADAFAQVQGVLAPLVEEYQHQVTWQTAPDVPLVQTDSAMLIKILGYLVRNAIQYTPKGGTVSIKAERVSDKTARITVADTGVGMKPDEIERLGEPFYRADHELVTSTKGYGLGVPLAKGFLALLNSQLMVESALGQGSRFSFMVGTTG